MASDLREQIKYSLDNSRESKINSIVEISMDSDVTVNQDVSVTVSWIEKPEDKNDFPSLTFSQS